MAHDNATADTPRELTDLLDYIEENTGLMGDNNRGRAGLSVGGTTLMIVADRPSLDRYSQLLGRIESDPDLTIVHIGLKSVRGGTKVPYLEVEA